MANGIKTIKRLEKLKERVRAWAAFKSVKGEEDDAKKLRVIHRVLEKSIEELKDGVDW